MSYDILHLKHKLRQAHKFRNANNTSFIPILRRHFKASVANAKYNIWMAIYVATPESSGVSETKEINFRGPETVQRHYK